MHVFVTVSRSATGLGFFMAISVTEGVDDLDVHLLLRH
jgi:hypothetical protein